MTHWPRRSSIRGLVAVIGMACSIPALSARALKFENAETETFVRKLVDSVNAGNPIRVSAMSVSRAYKKNEVAADAKYKDKFLFIEAVVDSVSKDPFGFIVVKLRAENQFLPSHARLDPKLIMLEGIEKSGKSVTMRRVTESEAAMSISRGSSIAMVCQGDGLIMGTVQYKACEILSR